MATYETDTPLHESFDHGTGALSKAWNADTSVAGQVTLRGNAGLMEWNGSAESGHGYGTYTVNAKFDGTSPGAAIVLWPGDDSWPGQEIDIGEMAADGSGRQYGAVHWNGGGWDAYETVIFEGVKPGVFHDYTVVWEPGRVTFLVDGQEHGAVTQHVPRDHDAGGMNNTIGALNNNGATSVTLRSVDYQPRGSGGGADTATAETPAPHADSVVVAAPSEPDPAPILAAAETPQAPAAPEPVADSGGGSGEVDWNAIAAQVMANYEATGKWFL